MTRGGFWTSEKLKERLPKIIDPYDKDAITSCSYELCVGGEGFVSGDGTQKKLLKDGESILIPPGQVALVITKETLTTPIDALGFLSIKSGMKLRGLINVSGFHVDPGFHGKLVFSMYNAGTQNIHLSAGSKLFLIWFCTLEGPTNDSYHGVHNHQEHIPDNAVTNLASRMPSPFTLEADIKFLRTEFLNLQTKYLLDLNSLETKYALEIKSLETKYALDTKNSELTYTSYFRNLDYTFKTAIALVFMFLGILLKGCVGGDPQSNHACANTNCPSSAPANNASIATSGGAPAPASAPPIPSPAPSIPLVPLSSQAHQGDKLPEPTPQVPK